MPVPAHEWREPSQAQFKDQFGNPGIQTRFRIIARLPDGSIRWQGWIDSRHDADEFIWAAVTGLLKFNRSLWKIPSPEWHPDIIGDFWVDITYEFVTTTFLTTTGSNQTHTSTTDWNNANNSIECLGGGASGACTSGSINHDTGGGAGSYSKITNFYFVAPGTTTATYNVGIGGGAISLGGTTASAGTNGGPTWFNNTANPGVGADNTQCSASNGTQGVAGTASQNGGAGGATTSSWGTTKNAGGRGGNLTGASGSAASGGGGAAGVAGVGGAGVDSASTTNSTTTAGGTADNGTIAGGASLANGNSGTEWDGSHGSGSGGGGGAFGSGGGTSGSGALYGGGGAGAVKTTSIGTAVSGAGKQGLIVVSSTVNLGKSWGYIVM